MLRLCLLLICCITIHSTTFAQKILVGIAGGTGSGKTTLAQNIQEAFEGKCVLISQDSYYKDLSHLEFEERANVNFDHPDSIDFALLREHLIELKGGRSILQPVYSFVSHSRMDHTHFIEPKDIILVEGILLLAIPEIRELFDVKIFVHTDDDIRMLRRIERDIKERGRSFDSVKEQYLKTVKPMHDLFVEPSKQYADIIVPKGGHNEVAVNLLIAKLNAQ
jgi:uridine kinase